MKTNIQLEELGLTKSESKVYLYLLESGLSTPPQISKGTKIARPNCYSILKDLKSKQLVQDQKTRKRTAYLARDPKSLLSEIEKRQELAQSLIPELRDLYSAQKNKPKIRFFESWEEVKEIYNQTLKAEGIFAIGSTENLSALEPKFLENYQKQLDKRKIVFKDLLSASAKDNTAKMMKEIRGTLHDIKFLPSSTEELPTDILIWKDNIALITLEKPIFGTIITSPPLATTFKAIVNILWSKL